MSYFFFLVAFFFLVTFFFVAFFFVAFFFVAFFFAMALILSRRLTELKVNVTVVVNLSQPQNTTTRNKYRRVVGQPLNITRAVSAARGL
ncbi:MAG: hypothetical protein AAGL98_09390 [Planctomycetota bacterium]